MSHSRIAFPHGRAITIALLMLGVFTTSTQGQSGDQAHRQSSDANKPIPECGLKRGVNFGNALEATSEGAWGFVIREEYFDKVVEAGFDHVRLPVSWTYHTSRTAPYRIDEAFFKRVDSIIKNCLTRGLKIIVNNHHYEALNANPKSELNRANAIWKQIAERYKGLPNRYVYFEILNEPQKVFSDKPILWDEHVHALLTTIRKSNPNRWVIVGPTHWNAISQLQGFELPNDPRLIATVHFYDPHPFTHQGAEWVDPSPPLNVTWTGKRFAPASGWDNWSWDSKIKGGEDGIAVSYEKGWAGFSLRSKQTLSSFDSIEIEFDSKTPLSLTVMDNDEKAHEIELKPTQGTTKLQFGHSEFGEPNGLQRVTIQNRTPNRQDSVRVIALRVTVRDKVIPAIVSEEEALRQTLAVARAWGASNGHPVYVGEFGSYSKADMNSRVKWTRAVRRACEDLDLPWAYWEFGAGFGIYDSDKGQYRQALLNSLIPAKAN